MTRPLALQLTDMAQSGAGSRQADGTVSYTMVSASDPN